MTLQSFEVNFDGIVGPTHHYGGLSFGNLASTKHRFAISNPKEAALQGLQKMKSLFELGIKQGVIPPQERPFLSLLRKLGFAGSNSQILNQVWKECPELLSQCSSASSMWTANAATVSPSSDCTDGKVHVTPANLLSYFHRSIEANATSKLLRYIFPHSEKFVHHPPLPNFIPFSDEGAANHTRFCVQYGQPGVEFFVYGRSTLTESLLLPKHYPARQTREASEAIVRNHKIHPSQVVYAQQSPEAIDAGVFHNDVISVGNQNVFFYHEKAFVDTPQVIHKLDIAFRSICKEPLILIPITEAELSIRECVLSYLFNSQIVTKDNGSMIILAPLECQEFPKVRKCIERIISENTPIKEVIYLNLRQSMQNGGGPACLRLRVVLTQDELAATNPYCLMNEELYKKLINWVQKHYRDRLSLEDICDEKLHDEVIIALNELSEILQINCLTENGE